MELQQMLQWQLLLYLDKRRYLADMKDNCEKFLEKQSTQKTINKFPPFRFLLEIDVMDLLDLFPNLGEFLLKEPLKWQRMCNEILFACLQSTKGECNQNIEPGQVIITPRLKCMPRLLIPPNARYFSGLVSYEGLLIAVSNTTSYVYHTVWSCPEECEGNEVILQYIPKAPPKCCVCRSVLFENGGLRRCGEQVTATIQIKNDFLSKIFFIRDDLILKLRLGSRYSLYGIVMKKLTAVWSLEEIVPLPVPLTYVVPHDIQELYQACDGLPWKFIYWLASSIGICICPLNCFMHLKISLLMSLTSIKANILTKSRIIHVLVAGYDTRYVGALMTEAAKLADRSVFLGTSNTIVSRSLMGSSGGVCMMPLPLYSYSQKQISSVLSSMESGEVALDASKTTLSTAVWAQGMDFKKIILFNVASIFGMVCRGDFGEYNDEIVNFTLQRAVEPIETSVEEIQALRDVAVYIDLVAGIEVSLDEFAEILLRDYFLAARKERPRGVSVGSMGALVATCITSARLCRRSIANVEDAVFAIWLNVSGSPEPRFAPDEYLQTPADIRQLQKTLNNFKVWLEQFIGR